MSVLCAQKNLPFIDLQDNRRHQTQTPDRCYPRWVSMSICHDMLPPQVTLSVHSFRVAYSWLLCANMTTYTKPEVLYSVGLHVSQTPPEDDPEPRWWAAGKVLGKVFPYSLPSVGPGADPGVQAVSPQVTWSESRHLLSSSLPLLSAGPAVTPVAFTRWRYL